MSIMDAEREEYLNERKLLLSFESNAADKFDRTIIVLSAGALGLSITFLSQTNSAIDFIWLLFVCWILFIISSLLSLMNLIVSQMSFSKQREILTEIYTKVPEKDIQVNIYRRWVGKLNLVSLICTIFGIILLTLFTALNLDKMEV